MPAERSTFRATTEDGSLSGEVAFLRYGDLTYRLIGYSGADSWSGYSRSVGSTISSFAPLSDPEILAVQPLRLAITRVDEAMSLNSFVDRFPQPVDVETLARLNRLTPGAVMSAGTRIKTVVGTPVG